MCIRSSLSCSTLTWSCQTQLCMDKAVCLGESCACHALALGMFWNANEEPVLSRWPREVLSDRMLAAGFSLMSQACACLLDASASCLLEYKV